LTEGSVDLASGLDLTAILTGVVPADNRSGAGAASLLPFRPAPLFQGPIDSVKEPFA